MRPILPPPKTLFALATLAALLAAGPALAQGTGYVTNATAGTIAAIDLSTLASTGTAALTPSASSRGAVLVRSVGRLYVAIPAGNAVAVLDSTTLATAATVAVGAGPHSLAAAPNGSTVYATNNSAGTVSVIDTASSAVVATVAVGSAPRGLAVSKDGLRVYVANYGANSVSVISTATNAVTATIALGVGGPVDLLPSDDGNFVYVATDTGNSLTVVSLAFSSVLRSVDVGAAANAVATEPLSSGLYVPTQAGAVKKISSSSFSVASTLSGLVNPAAVGFSADSQTGYAVDSGNGKLQSFNPSTMVAGAAGTLAAGIRGFAAADTVAEAGLWYNPSESGRGYSLEQRGQNLFIAYYVYGGGGSSVWYVTSCALSGTTCTGTMQQYQNGITLTALANNVASLGPVGTASLAFTTPTMATMTWPGGTVALQRFPFAGSTPQAGAAGTPESGWWWDSSYSGAGWFIESQRSSASANSLFIAGYLYRSDGSAVWYTSTGAMITTTSYQGTIYEYAGGSPITTPRFTPPTSSAGRGTISVQFAGTTRATLTLPSGQTFNLSRYTF